MRTMPYVMELKGAIANSLLTSLATRENQVFRLAEPVRLEAVISCTMPSARTSLSSALTCDTREHAMSESHAVRSSTHSAPAKTLAILANKTLGVTSRDVIRLART
jgi:hypothetical protein